jgi:adenosine deaminase
VVADAAEDNIRYMELRFTPKALNNIVNTDYKSVVTWVCEAANESAKQHNLDVRLIVSVNRHESLEIAMLAYDAALACRDMGIVGIDLAGAEANFPPELFRPLFERARADGMNITIHAGEWAGADSVRSAVELGAKRIGHGIRSIEDIAVVDLLKERGIVLEVCPTSNVDSGSVESIDQHPLGRLHEAGVRTTINTDDPLISGITLSEELRRASASFGFSTADIRRQTLTAAENAFLPEADRVMLVNRFRNWLFPPGTRPLSAIAPSAPMG